MPSALSTTDIANMALDYLDEVYLNDFNTDTGSVARWMQRNFWPTAWSLMRKHPFNFAIARASLTADATAPAFGWSYSYTMPSDCLRVLPVTADGTEDGTPVTHKIEGQSILTDAAAPLYIRYIKRIDNTGLFDNQFCDVLAAILAQKAAHFISGKQSYAQLMGQMAAGLLNEAQMIDALEGTPEDPIADDWINARQ